MSHCRQLQKAEALGHSLHELEAAFREVDRKSEAKENNLQVDRAWIYLTCQFANVCMCKCHLSSTLTLAVIIDWSLLNLNHISIVMWCVRFVCVCCPVICLYTFVDVLELVKKPNDQDAWNA